HRHLQGAEKRDVPLVAVPLLAVVRADQLRHGVHLKPAVHPAELQRAPAQAPDLPRLVVQGRFLTGRRAADNSHLLDGQPHPLVPIPACQRASHLCYRISNRNTFGTSISRGQGVCHGSHGRFRNDLTGSAVESLGWQDGFKMTLAAHHAVQPPSTGRTAPVTKLEASEARKTAAPLSSTGSPVRPSGVRRSRLRRKSGCWASTPGGGKAPGERAFTRMPKGARWHAA